MNNVKSSVPTLYEVLFLFVLTDAHDDESSSATILFNHGYRLKVSNLGPSADTDTLRKGWYAQQSKACNLAALMHDDVIKWTHFPRYWPFVWGIHWSTVNSPHKGQWRGALMFSLICVWINGWVSNREAGDLRRYRAHYDVIVMGNTSFSSHYNSFEDRVKKSKGTRSTNEM